MTSIDLEAVPGELPPGRPRLPPSAASADAPAAIEVTDVTYRYSRQLATIWRNPSEFFKSNKENETVLQNISLSVGAGSIYALLGSSGCGKTTLLKCILTRHHPQSGSIRIFGSHPAFTSIPGSGVGYMPQELALYTDFTITETFRYFGQLYRMSSRSIRSQTHYFISFLNLPSSNRPVGQLSGGQQRRVSLASALLHRPPLIVLDEPTVGVDPMLRAAIWSYLERICSVDKVTILITTHYLEEARRAGTIGLMRHGSLLVQGHPEMLLTEHHLDCLEKLFLKLSLEQDSALQSSSSIPEIQVKVTERSCSTDPGTPPPQTYFDYSRFCALLSKNRINSTRNLLFTLFFSLVPALNVAIFIICSGPAPHNIPVAVINEENPALWTESYLSMLSPDLKQVMRPDLVEAIEEWREGRWQAVMHFSGNFSESLDTRREELALASNATIYSSNVHLYLDMSNPIVGFTILYQSLLNYQSLLRNYLSSLGYNPQTLSPPLDFTSHLVYGEVSIDLLKGVMPGMVILVASFVICTLSALYLVIEQEDGLLERSFIGGVRPLECLLTHVLTQILFLLVQLVLMFGVIFALSGMQSRGPFYLVFLLCFMQGFAGILLGIAIACLFPDKTATLMAIFGSLMPLMYISGILWPAEGLPDYILPVTYVLPQKYAMEAVRSVLFRGWTLKNEIVQLGFTVTGIWCAGCWVLAMITFRKFG